MAKKSSPKAASKSEVLANLAAATDLSKKQIATVLEALTTEIGKAIGKKGSGAFQIPGLCKIVRKEVPAKPAQKGVMVLGQLRDIPAKPARKKVVVRPLKALKAMV